MRMTAFPSATMPGLRELVRLWFSPMAAELESTKPGIEVATLTDVGLQRANNEDSYLYWEPESAEEFARKGRLAIVADGMGGYEGGLEASRMAVETVRQVYVSQVDGDAQAALVAGIQAGHAAIQQYAVEHPELQGMGTTCTAAAIVGEKLCFAHVGDSRLYLIREGVATRLTRDDSYVGRLVESGIVRPEDAESHPQRHILTAALGSGREVEPNVPGAPVAVQAGDVLVLCSDGLWSQVPEAELARIAQTKTPAEACSQLVRAAIQRGGPDNITVIVLRVG